MVYVAGLLIGWLCLIVVFTWFGLLCCLFGFGGCLLIWVWSVACGLVLIVSLLVVVIWMFVSYYEDFACVSYVLAGCSLGLTLIRLLLRLLCLIVYGFILLIYWFGVPVCVWIDWLLEFLLLHYLSLVLDLVILCVICCLLDWFTLGLVFACLVSGWCWCMFGCLDRIMFTMFVGAVWCAFLV